MLEELTIGIEEEYQIINPETRELTSYIQEFLQRGRIVLKDQVKPEFMQSQIEVGSHVCRILWPSSNLSSNQDCVGRGLV